MNRTASGDRTASRLTILLWPAALALALLAAWTVATVFPVYFRADDVGYLQWAAQHDLADCFNPDAARLFGMFRPMQNLCWKLLYTHAGLDPFPYQFTLGALYFVSLVFFLALLLAMHRSGAAVAGFATYLLVFAQLQYIVLWFSDFTYVIELFFLQAALFFFWQALTGHAAFAVPAALAFAGALLSKEPAAVIGPCVMAAMLWERWYDLSAVHRRRFAVLTAAAFAAGAAWLVATGSLFSRLATEPAVAHAAAPGLMDRWHFYGATLASGVGGVLLMLIPVAALVLPRPWYKRRRYWLVALATLAGGIALRNASPGLWLATLLALVAFGALRDPRARIGAVWFVVPLLGVMTIAYMVRTYLVEASFGLALLLTTLLDDAGPREPAPRPPRWSALVQTGAAAALLLLAAGNPFSARRGGPLEALRTLSASRVATGRAVDWLRHNAGTNRVVLVTYEDRGVDYERDILPLPDLEKARVQKTLVSPTELRILLNLHEGRPVDVCSLREFMADTSAREALAFFMNEREHEFAAGEPLRFEPLHETRDERAYAGIHRVVKTRD